FVPQDDIVHRELTVREALTFSARLRLTLDREEIAALVERTIERLGLAEHAAKRISMLSGGQRKRVSIGIELLAKPSVLFLDEPSSGLDPATEEALMVLLQSLTLTNLTVVCTTHVLQKAYLFDRILFIQGGRLVFAGNPDEARRHFFLGVNTESGESLQRSPLERIYSLLIHSKEPAEHWEQKFLESPFSAALLSPDPLPTGEVATSPGGQRVKPAGFFGSLLILLQRQWSILVADPLNVLFLLAQAAVIGTLIAWVSDDEPLRLFLAVIATMWFGCSNGAQQIVAELPIFRRERVCGLGMHTYIVSKIGFLLGLTAAQAVLLFVTLQGTSHLFHPRDFEREAFLERLEKRIASPAKVAQERQDFSNIDPLAEQAVDVGSAPVVKPTLDWQMPVLAWVAWFFDLENNILQSGERDLFDEQGEQLRGADGLPLTIKAEPVWEVVGIALGLRALALVLAASVGVGMGLAISALVQTPTQAVMWVPLILIPQILFGGYVVKISEMSAPVRAVSAFMPSYLVQRVMDVSNLYGQTTPFLTNRTKTPLFLTADGAKETVRWTENGRRFSQDYDKLSPFNTSWQNLLIDPDRVGEHKQVATQVGGGMQRVLRDSVEKRGDVRYEKGTLFRFATPAWRAISWLGVWGAICYLLVFVGLATRQTGK
ncbi:MAG: ABC transporter permease, partial [Verrucomicrobiia bacterium]